MFFTSYAVLFYKTEEHCILDKRVVVSNYINRTDALMQLNILMRDENTTSLTIVP